MISGRATVTWLNFKSREDVRRYLPSGTITADVSLQNCDPVQATVPIRTGTPASPGETLRVFTSANSSTPNRYDFAITGAGTFTANCGTPRGPVSMPASMMAVTVGFCSSPDDRLPYTSEASLSGGPWSCPLLNVQSASFGFGWQ